MDLTSNNHTYSNMDRLKPFYNPYQLNDRRESDEVCSSPRESLFQLLDMPHRFPGLSSVRLLVESITRLAIITAATAQHINCGQGLSNAKFQGSLPTFAGGPQSF